MTWNNNDPKPHGYEIGQRLRVINDFDYNRVGQVGILVRDDHDSTPLVLSFVPRVVLGQLDTDDPEAYNDYDYYAPYQVELAPNDEPSPEPAQPFEWTDIEQVYARWLDEAYTAPEDYTDLERSTVAALDELLTHFQVPHNRPPGRRLTVGDYVQIVMGDYIDTYRDRYNGRVGKIVLDDHDDVPYAVQFDPSKPDRQALTIYFKEEWVKLVEPERVETTFALKAD